MHLEVGSIWEEENPRRFPGDSGGIQEAPRRHPEAPRRHPEAPRDTQEAPRRIRA